MSTRTTLAAALLSLAVVSVSRANFLTNPNLELGAGATPSLPDNTGLIYMSAGKNSTALGTAWHITSGTVDLVPNSYWQSSSGDFSVDLIGTPGPGAIAQTVETTVGDHYILTFDFSANPENLTGEKGTSKVLQVEALGSNGVTVLASKQYVGTSTTRTNSDMIYVQRTLEFTATGPTTTIQFAALASLNLPAGKTAAQLYCGPVIDNLDLELSGSVTPPPTPEPASLGILGLGGMLLLRRRTRGV